jgi:GntR family transcriptional regulator, transcriptional repressor for pyruvate dehydrogenase complex
MQALRDATSPLGARQGRIALLADGFDISEATVSRMLRDFDNRGWTTSAGRKGRVLTAAGSRHATLTREQEHATRQVQQAIGVQTAQDLLNLLYARRTVERETARQAALSATGSDVAHLRELLAAQEECVAHDRPARTTSLDLHRAIAALAPNHIIRAMTELILAGRLERIETILDLVISSPTAEFDALEEHRAIVDAIEAGDPVTAERLMQDHMERLIDEAERYITNSPGDLVGRVLKILDNSII